jgi:hypothetical protein
VLNCALDRPACQIVDAAQPLPDLTPMYHPTPPNSSNLNPQSHAPPHTHIHTPPPAQVIDVAGYYLDLIVQQYDSIQHLDGQPLQSMIKDKASGQYLFNFLYWNKKLIEETERLRALGAGAAA